MNIVDLILLLFVALAAVEGLRLGAVLQVFSFGGFWIGMFLGALLASVTASHVQGQTARAVVALATMLGMAMLLGGVGRYVGVLLFKRVHRTKLGGLDSALGVAVSVAASLLAMWLVASTLASSPSQSLNSAISGSAIVRALDRILPPPPAMFAEVQHFLSDNGFPSVFAQLPPLAAGSVPLPSSAEVDAAVQAAGPSTVKIVGEGCGQIQEGSGFVVAPGLVVTNAHVVAGIPHPEVEDRSGFHHTTVVLFDPSFDLAILRVSNLTDPSLPLDPGTVPRGTGAVVMGYPGGGPFTYGPAGVLAEFQAEGRDIYGQGLTVRDVYEIQAIVRPGNSGGPLVTPAGKVIGVVFSRSTTNSDIGYALTSPGVIQRVDRVISSVAPVGTGACIAG